MEETEVDVHPLAVITGDTVEVVARHDNVDVSSLAIAECDCGVGDSDATAITDYISESNVIGQPGATVMARDLLVGATQNVIRYDRRAEVDGGIIDPSDDSERGVFSAGRRIQFDADVVLFSDPSPELVVDGDGTISEAVNVTVNGGLGKTDVVAGDTISVDDIINDDSGTARFEANVVPPHDSVEPPDGSIRGTQSTFAIGSTYDTVEITNLSDKDLVVNQIDVANPTASPRVDLDAQSVTLQFDVTSHEVQPTELLIRNQGASDIGLNGLVNNPIGSSRIQNLGGNILNGAGPPGDGVVGNADCGAVLGNFGFQSVVVVPSRSAPTLGQLRSTLISAALAAVVDDSSGKKDFGSRKAAVRSAGRVTSDDSLSRAVRAALLESAALRFEDTVELAADLQQVSAREDETTTVDAAIVEQLSSTVHYSRTVHYSSRPRIS